MFQVKSGPQGLKKSCRQQDPHKQSHCGHDGRGPQDIFQSEQPPDQEKQQDIQRALVQQRKQKGLNALSHCLKHGNDHKQHRVNRYGDAQDPQEFCSIKDRIPVIDEKSHKLRGEQIGAHTAQQENARVQAAENTTTDFIRPKRWEA